MKRKEKSSTMSAEELQSCLASAGMKPLDLFVFTIADPNRINAWLIGQEPVPSLLAQWLRSAARDGKPGARIDLSNSKAARRAKRMTAGQGSGPLQSGLDRISGRGVDKAANMGTSPGKRQT